MIWILTEEYNEYDQHGQYFIAAWNHKPSADELTTADKYIVGKYAVHVLNGGGRIGYDHQWWNLFEYSADAQ